MLNSSEKMASFEITHMSTTLLFDGSAALTPVSAYALVSFYSKTHLARAEAATGQFLSPGEKVLSAYCGPGQFEGALTAEGASQENGG